MLYSLLSFCRVSTASSDPICTPLRPYLVTSECGDDEYWKQKERGGAPRLESKLQVNQKNSLTERDDDLGKNDREILFNCVLGIRYLFVINFLCLKELQMSLILLSKYRMSEVWVRDQLLINQEHIC